jgi:hypothetical protein
VYGLLSGILAVLLGGLGLALAVRRVLRHYEGLVNDYEIALSESAVTVSSPRLGSIEIPWNELQGVEVRTTSGGPFSHDVFWRLTRQRGESVVEVPLGARGEDRWMDALGRLPGFDFEQLTRAMASTADATFRCWPGEESER